MQLIPKSTWLWLPEVNEMIQELARTEEKREELKRLFLRKAVDGEIVDRSLGRQLNWQDWEVLSELPSFSMEQKEVALEQEAVEEDPSGEGDDCFSLVTRTFQPRFSRTEVEKHLVLEKQPAQMGDDNAYLPKYLKFMLRAVRELGLTEVRVNLKIIKAWIIENWDERELGERSVNKVDMMATFLREPEHQRGGLSTSGEKGSTAKTMTLKAKRSSRNP